MADLFDTGEQKRADAMIATMIDGWEGTEVDEGLIFLLTDVDDWECLSLALAGRAAMAVIALAQMTGLDPYVLWERCVS